MFETCLTLRIVTHFSLNFRVELFIIDRLKQLWEALWNLRYQNQYLKVKIIVYY